MRPLLRIINSFLNKPCAQPSSAGIEWMAEKYKQRCAQWRLTSSNDQHKRKSAVLVCPWLSTAVPFVSLECAFAMAEKGTDVTLLWDSQCLFAPSTQPLDESVLLKLLPTIRKYFRVIDVHSHIPLKEANWTDEARAIVAENAIAVTKGEEAAKQLMASSATITAQSAQHMARIEGVLKLLSPHMIFVPGGVYSTSGLYIRVATQMAIQTVCFDSDKGILLLTSGGVAAHHADIPVACELLSARLADNPYLEAPVLAAATDELEKRRGGCDAWGFQIRKTASSAVPTCDVLVPLNLRWDTAALLRQKLFTNVREWIESIVEWAKNNPEAQVYFREHPWERFNYAKSTDNTYEWIAVCSQETKNIHYVKAEDPYNTYDLLDNCKVVLPHTSTIAVEAAMLGVPSVITTCAYYTSSGFSIEPTTISQFHEAISKCLERRFIVTQRAKRKAALLYYLAQICAPLKTCFTPHAADFEEWIAMPPSVLWSTNELQDLLSALVGGEPLSYLRAVRALGMNPPPTYQRCI